MFQLLKSYFSLLIIHFDTWLLHVTSFSLTQITELSQLHISSGFLQKRNFLERQGTKVSSRDCTRDFFYLR